MPNPNRPPIDSPNTGFDRPHNDHQGDEDRLDQNWQHDFSGEGHDLGIIGALVAIQYQAHDPQKTGNLDERMNDHAPGIQGIRRFWQDSTGNPCHQGYLDGPRQQLPPDIYLPVLNAFPGIMNAVLSEIFDESRRRTHIEQLP